MGTKNSIREHMEDKGIGPEKKAAEREEKRVKALAAIERGEQPAKSSSKPKKEKKKGSDDEEPVDNDLEIDDAVDSEA